MRLEDCVCREELDKDKRNLISMGRKFLSLWEITEKYIFFNPGAWI